MKLGTCLILALCWPVPAVSGPAPPLRILLTNDDGIDSAELHALCLELAELGQVTVCAPDGNRSGSSQSVTLGQTMRVREAQVEGALRAVAVSGTPADATSFGILALAGEEPFDLVVSGINQGANVGDVSHYSGTVGAAMEAAYRGVPAIAVSEARGADTAATAAFTRRFAALVLEHPPRPGVVWSINAPRNAEGPPLVAPMGGSYVEVGYKKQGQEDGAEVWRGLVEPGSAGPEGCDTALHLAGHVTVTPLQFDWTDRQALDLASDWDLGD